MNFLVRVRASGQKAKVSSLDVHLCGLTPEDVDQAIPSVLKRKISLTVGSQATPKALTGKVCGLSEAR